MGPWLTIDEVSTGYVLTCSVGEAHSQGVGTKDNVKPFFVSVVSFGSISLPCGMLGDSPGSVSLRELIPKMTLDTPSTVFCWFCSLYRCRYYCVVSP